MARADIFSPFSSLSPSLLKLDFQRITKKNKTLENLAEEKKRMIAL